MNLLSRLRQIATVGGVESLGVAVGGVSGLLIVNVLPKDQYAAYTFLAACMMLVLGVTDLGLAHCCMPVVGQRSNEVPWVVGACQQVFRKRWLLLGLGLLLVVPYWFLTSRQHGWFGPAYFLASALMLTVVLLALREHYGGTILVILGHIPSLNRIGFTSSLVRITFVGTVLLLPTTSWTVAGVVAATAATSIVSVMFFRHEFRVHEIGDSRLDADDARRVDAQVIQIAKPLVLPAIFYQVQGVVTVFLVSLFGTSNMMAEVGAFGRLSMVLIVVDRVTGILLFPAIARSPTGTRLQSIVLRAHLAYLCTMGLALLTSIYFPQYWILLLGSKYSSLTPLVWMVFLSSMLQSASGFAFRSLTVRGATSGQSYSILVTLTIQVLYLAVIGVTDLRSVLGFGIATSVANFGYQYALLTMRWRQWRMGPAQARL